MPIRRTLAAIACLFPLTLAARTQDAPAQSAPIDRHALVTRHNITVTAIDPNGAMAVGNGEFAFNFDVTGLQTIATTGCQSQSPRHVPTLRAASTHEWSGGTKWSLPAT
jgi:hypothetical protein